MAVPGRVIENRISGFRLEWLQTGKETQGEFTRCRMNIQPASFMPVRHIHPRQVEKFEVLAGKLRIECGGHIRLLDAGESFEVPVGSPHQWWNYSAVDELLLQVTMAPAHNWEAQMEQVFGIMNARGKLSFLQIMAMAREFEMYIAGPPLFLQKLMSSALYPLARLMGYKKFYPEYSPEGVSG